jgi:hypothetical protein
MDFIHFVLQCHFNSIDDVQLDLNSRARFSSALAPQQHDVFVPYRPLSCSKSYISSKIPTAEMDFGRIPSSNVHGLLPKHLEVHGRSCISKPNDTTSDQHPCTVFEPRLSPSSFWDFLDFTASTTSIPTARDRFDLGPHLDWFVLVKHVGSLLEPPLRLILFCKPLTTRLCRSHYTVTKRQLLQQQSDAMYSNRKDKNYMANQYSKGTHPTCHVRSAQVPPQWMATEDTDRFVTTFQAAYGKN